MFNPNGSDVDSYPQRLLLAVLPVVLVAFIPASVAIWKEIRAGREDDRLEKKEDERFERIAAEKAKKKAKKRLDTK